MKEKRISRKNLPLRFPLASAIGGYLLLEHFAAPGWMYGVYATFCVLVLFTVIEDLVCGEKVDVLAALEKEDKEES